jgi:hypothetical protein
MAQGAAIPGSAAALQALSTTPPPSSLVLHGGKRGAQPSPSSSAQGSIAFFPSAQVLPGPTSVGSLFMAHMEQPLRPAPLRPLLHVLGAPPCEFPPPWRSGRSSHGRHPLQLPITGAQQQQLPWWRPNFFFQRLPLHLPPNQLPSPAAARPFLLFPSVAARGPYSDCSRGVQVSAQRCRSKKKLQPCHSPGFLAASAARVPRVRRSVQVRCGAVSSTPGCPPGVRCFCATPLSSLFTPVRPRQSLFDSASALFSYD